ncbi:Alpha/Beta hydrolase protein [Jimgerdemannia flammicorona]|uniref:Alpha/Beta hydrolase protein n=1 Tax=Jimgerdemannia flammicorona TaxID=994334 RepID=A0A433DHG9_9FUNG|nr:Alpha/Beta hydrolase protein [Jimgerdemannia flammicorona]
MHLPRLIPRTRPLLTLSYTTATVTPLPFSRASPRLKMPSPYLETLHPTKKSARLEAAERQMFRNVITPLEFRMVPISRKFMTGKEDKKQYYISTVSTVVEESEDKKPDLVLVHGCKYMPLHAAFCQIFRRVVTRAPSQLSRPLPLTLNIQPILLTGGGAKGIWVRNIDTLSTFYRVHAIDLLGWGRSSRPRYCLGEDPVKAQRWWVESLEAWRRAMGIEKFTLVGHSMGGFVSASYALEYKDRLDKLILLSAIGKQIHHSFTIFDNFFPYPSPTPLSLSLYAQPGLQGFTLSTTPSPFPLHTRLLISSLWSLTPQRLLTLLPTARVLRILSSRRSDTISCFGFGEDDDTVVRYIYHLATSQPVSGEVAFTRLLTPTKAWHLPLRERLRDLSGLDVALVYGQFDWIDPTFAVEEVLRGEMLDKAKVYILPDAGHHGYVENWVDLNAIIVGFHAPGGCGVREFDVTRDQVGKAEFSIA